MPLDESYEGQGIELERALDGTGIHQFSLYLTPEGIRMEYCEEHYKYRNFEQKFGDGVFGNSSNLIVLFPYGFSRHFLTLTKLMIDRLKNIELHRKWG